MPLLLGNVRVSQQVMIADLAVTASVSSSGGVTSGGIASIWSANSEYDLGEERNILLLEGNIKGGSISSGFSAYSNGRGVSIGGPTDGSSGYVILKDGSGTEIMRVGLPFNSPIKVDGVRYIQVYVFIQGASAISSTSGGVDITRYAAHATATVLVKLS